MYPLRRMALEIYGAKRGARIPVDATFRMTLRVMPWDIDPFGDLNNGRTLTLMDLGRIGFGMRTGFAQEVRRRGYFLTVAGSSLRYRQRIFMWDRVELATRAAGYDARFVYLLQTFRRAGVACSSALIRSAIVGKDGIVPPSEVAGGLDGAERLGELPDWIAAWVAADAMRPWPPED